jgi:hypothetical protein
MAFLRVNSVPRLISRQTTAVLIKEYHRNWKEPYWKWKLWPGKGVTKIKRWSLAVTQHAIVPANNTAETGRLVGWASLFCRHIEITWSLTRSTAEKKAMLSACGCKSYFKHVLCNNGMQEQQIFLAHLSQQRTFTHRSWAQSDKAEILYPRWREGREYIVRIRIIIL